MTKRIPQDPRAFPPLYSKVIEKVSADSYLTIECSSVAEAQSLKFQLNRYFKSLQHHDPNGRLTELSWMIEQRVKGSLLMLIRRDQDPRLETIEKALHTPREQQATIDPIARTVRSFEEEFEELRRLEAEGKLLPPDTNQD